MAARDQLIAYGYVLGADGKYRRPGKSTQVWEEVPGKGWLRFDPDGQGNEVPEVYKVSDAYQGTSGLNKLHHAGSFDWVYPEEEVEKIYREAVKAAAAQLHKARERKGVLADALAASVAVPAPTEEQLAHMQNAQAGQAAAAKGTEEEPKKKKSWWG